MIPMSIFNFFRKKKVKTNENLILNSISNSTSGPEDSILSDIFDSTSELESVVSFTVEWKVKQGWSDNTLTHFKVFTNKDSAIEFEKKIKACAEFLKCWVSTNITENSAI